jgi:putative transposase
MPRKTKTAAAADQAAQPQIPADFLDQLVTGPMTAGQVQGLFEVDPKVRTDLMSV